jgi:hypothetical protein
VGEATFTSRSPMRGTGVGTLRYLGTLMVVTTRDDRIVITVGNRH